MNKEEILKLYITNSIGSPYIWGGDGNLNEKHLPEGLGFFKYIVKGFDCSGYIQYLLTPLGLDPKGDQTSGMLHDYFLNNGIVLNSPNFGNLLFFGKNTSSITHIAMAINNDLMVESGGGGSKNKTIEDANKNGASVRIRPIANRKDLQHIIKINGL